MTIKTELLQIQTANAEHILFPLEVVTWARTNPDSALHRAIEWDNQRAADAHRLWQVRQLIQLHVTSEDGAPQMVSLTFDRKANGGYRSIDDVVRVPQLREIMLQDALDELNRVQAKFQKVTELTKVWEEANTVRQRSRRRRAA